MGLTCSDIGPHPYPNSYRGIQTLNAVQPLTFMGIQPLTSIIGPSPSILYYHNLPKQAKTTFFCSMVVAMVVTMVNGCPMAMVNGRPEAFIKLI